ncbi:MAG: hypothetical protein JKY31_06015 [Rhodobacteraceae bacterium]|nr:hypothetical protein [Paracoccaceae bacterium]
MAIKKRGLGSGLRLLVCLAFVVMPKAMLAGEFTQFVTHCLQRDGLFESGQIAALERAYAQIEETSPVFIRSKQEVRWQVTGDSILNGVVFSISQQAFSSTSSFEGCAFSFPNANLLSILDEAENFGIGPQSWEQSPDGAWVVTIRPFSNLVSIQIYQTALSTSEGSILHISGVSRIQR